MSIQSFRMMFDSSVARSMSNSLSGLLTWDTGRQSTRMRRNLALGHASTGEDSLEIRNTLSRRCLVRETWRTSLWTTSSRRSEKCYGDTFEEQDQQALDNHFDMRQGRAEAFQAYINREEMMSLSVQNSTKIALDDKMRGYWLIRTSAFSEQEMSTGLSAGKRAIQQTIVSRQRERKFTMTVVDGETVPVTRQAVLVISFTPSPTVRNPSQRQIWESLDEQDLWYATDDKAEFEAMIGLREARMELQHATTSRRFWLQLACTCDIEQIKIHPRIEEVTTCNRWGDECPPKGHRWR